MSPARSRSPTSEEVALFRETAAGPDPLPEDDGPAAAPPSGLPGRGGTAPGGGLDKRTEQKLRRGLIRPERRLDLHGHTLAEAEGMLEDFVVDAHEEGCRCVLVITGRKLGHAGPEGVLWHALPRLARAGRLARRVILAVPANRKDGGDGASYLYLSRRARGAGP